jgi:putative ABC transport system ATP-binding protein
MADAAVVSLRGVSKSFPASDGGAPVEVLRDVHLDLGAGGKASLIGPSGSGKSTLLSLIAGLLRPDAGTVAVDGVAIDGLGDADRARLRAERIGIALQSGNLIPFLSARENIELALGFSTPISRGAARHRAMALLERFGVAHRAEHKPRHLSGGETQRVALAVAMVSEPALLLADEVVAALDGETASQVVDEVLDAPLAVLYVTHDRALADRVEQRYELRGHRVEAR